MDKNRLKWAGAGIAVFSTVLGFGLDIADIKIQYFGYVLIAVGASGLLLCASVYVLELAPVLKRTGAVTIYRYAPDLSNREIALTILLVLPAYCAMVGALWYPVLNTIGSYYLGVLVFVFLVVQCVKLVKRYWDWVGSGDENADD